MSPFSRAPGKGPRLSTSSLNPPQLIGVGVGCLRVELPRLPTEWGDRIADEKEEVSPPAPRHHIFLSVVAALKVRSGFSPEGPGVGAAHARGLSGARWGGLPWAKFPLEQTRVTRGARK